jgi:hypothetical protein
MAIQGLRHTGTGSLATDERPKNWREGILLLFPNGKAPFFALTSMMRSQMTDDPEFSWWEKEVSSQRVALGDDLGTGDATATVTSGATEFKLGDIIYVEENGELILVNQDPISDVTLNIEREYADTTAVAITYDGAGVNPNLLKVGSCYEEASSKPTVVGYIPTKKYNYTQIFRDNLSVSRTAQKTRLRTRALVREAKRETTHYHAAGIERAFIFGARKEEARNGKPARVTDGLLTVLNRENGWDGSTGTNVVDWATTYSASEDYGSLETELDQMFRYGSTEKLAFCGNTAMRVLQQIIRKSYGANMQLVTGQKEFGMDVSRLVCPFGTLVLKTHPLFNQITSGTTGGTAYYGMDAWIMVLDMDNLRYRYIDDTFYKTEQEENGLDGMESGFITECGLEFQHAKTHYLLQNFHTAATET